MSIASALGTTVRADEQTNGNLGVAAPDEGTVTTKTVSDFITVQSLTNFSAMTGGIAAAWGGASNLSAVLHGRWFPFLLCLVFGLMSLITSRPWETVVDDHGQPVPNQPSSVVKMLQPSFISLINTFILYSAVLGVSVGTIVS